MIGLRLLRVRGRSMEPTLRDGDVVVVAQRARPRLGSLALVRLPPEADGARRPLAVKRVTGTDPDDPSRLWVERDNPREGVDSWLVGSIAADDVIGVVLGRLPRALNGLFGAR